MFLCVLLIFPLPRRDDALVVAGAGCPMMTDAAGMTVGRMPFCGYVRLRSKPQRWVLGGRVNKKGY
jgi:hypothetical protein